MYSMPVALITSTMKSEPGRVIILSRLGAFSLPSELDSAPCAGLFAAATCVPITAAAVAAAPLRNARRSIASLLMTHLQRQSSDLMSRFLLKPSFYNYRRAVVARCGAEIAEMTLACQSVI